MGYNYVFLCLSKKDAGPMIVKSISCSLGESLDNKAIFILSNEIENKEQLVNCCPSNIHYLFLDNGNKKNSLLKLISFLINGRKSIFEIIDHNQYDLYMEIFGHPWGHIISKQLNIENSCVICHDPIPHKGEKILNKLIAWFNYKSADNIVILTKSFASYVKKRFKKPVYYMPLGLSSAYTCNEEIANESFNSDIINFVFLGRIEQYKGIKILLESFLLFDDSAKIHLTIAGKGDLTDCRDLLKQTRKVTVINKYLSDKEIIDLLSNRRAILVLPYLSATQSGIVPIAIALGVPIIASDTGGLKEQLDGGNIGLLSKPGDSKDLFSKMKLFVDNPGLINTEREKVIAYQSELSWKEVLKKLCSNMYQRKTCV